MVPLGALMKVEPTFGPTRVTRYNGFPSADINGAANPGFSSSQAEAEIETLLQRTLPRGMSYEWTELTYQDRLTRDITVPGTGLKLPTLAAVLAISVLLVILVLAAQYESWSLPMVIVLIVPMGILSALFGVWVSSFPPFMQPGDLNIFTQVALVVLVGLACKNAILIVEFAKELEEHGHTLLRCHHHRLPHAAAAHPDDLHRLLRRCDAAHLGQRRGQRDAPCHGHCGVLGHGGCHALRHLPHAGVLCAAARSP